MSLGARIVRQFHLRRITGRCLFLLLIAAGTFPSTGVALPRRLILGLDGIAYRDMKALQAGVTYTNIWGRQHHRQAFNSAEGYFPVSRMISSFPSTSDVAWTEIFGNRPLPGYQRTYFSVAANSQIAINGVTTSMEHETQMHWQVENGIIRTMGYVYPLHTYRYEVRELIKDFSNTKSKDDNYYAYVRTTDDAQHLGRDIFAMLGSLDEKLQKLRALYKAREDRDLEILILSDHGNNHAGAGRRVPVRTFLENAGYHIAKSIVASNDVILPTTGIESWVEIHNAPAATERLAEQLAHLEGVDILAARVPGRDDRFIVMNSKGERATIEWNPARNSFRYAIETGDPLHYRAVLEVLAGSNELDAGGFASADAWMAATMTHRYPLALERIVRSLTRVTLNPATILISLDNKYVHAGWLVKKGSELVIFGGTHGALDDLNSDGIVLSNFAPTTDTSSDRVAELYGGFPGLCNRQAEEDGAEFITGKEQALTRIARVPIDRNRSLLPEDEVFLRVWTPGFTRLDLEVPVEVTIEKTPHYLSAPNSRWDPKPVDVSQRHFKFIHPISFPAKCPYERIYALPPDLILEPEKSYRISGRIRDGEKYIEVFKFPFRTDNRGVPAAY